jgi:hypothetical protein
MKLPAVKHLEGQSAVAYRDDAVRNFSTVIDFDLTKIEMEPDQVEQALEAAREIFGGAQMIPLPAPGRP